MARKITLTMLDQKVAKTTGWSLHYAADMLGVRRDRNEQELREFFILWLDRNKFDIAPVWKRGEKQYRVFKKGHTPHEQINTAVAKLAGSGNEDVEIDIRDVLKEVKFADRYDYGNDAYRTFYHNMSVSLLPELADHNYWTQFLTEDNEGTAIHPPVVPSSHGKVFKAGFDADTAM